MAIPYTTDLLYDHADELIRIAEHEQERAEEDVVTPLICHHARLAIYHLLKGYLLQRDIRILPPASIASLQQQCQAVDPRFDVLELDGMACRYEAPGKQYCIERDVVDHCLMAAQQVQSLVRSQVPGY